MRFFRYFLICLFGLILSSIAAAQDLVWQISFAKSGLLADVRLNGYPVYRPADAEDNSGATMIGPWLKKGRNELVISLAAKSTPVGDDPMEDRSFDFSLFTLNRADTSATKNEIFRIKLPLKWNEELSLPKHLEFSIFLDNPPPVRLWEAAQDLGPTAISEARQLMSQVFAALENQDADAYFELFRWALEDTYTAYGWNTDGYIEKVRTALPEIFNSPDFKLSASDPQRLIYEPVSGARSTLLSVRGPNGEPAIQAGQFSQETLFLARINGKLTIVRN